jgi:hypothetical protein
LTTSHYHFPHYFEPVLERLLTLSVQKLISTPWTPLLDPIAPRIAALDEAVATRILRKTTQYIPTPPPFFAPILSLAQKLLLNAGILEGILQGRAGYWELAAECVRAATRASPLAQDDFRAVLAFVRDLVLACPVLVDRTWELYSSFIFPSLTADKSAGILINLVYVKRTQKKKKKKNFSPNGLLNYNFMHTELEY